MSPDENSYSFLLWPKMMTATSTEHSTESSCAFLNRPPLRFRKVLGTVMSVGAEGDGGRPWTYTERLRSSLMALISIFLRPMVTIRGCRRTGGQAHQTAATEKGRRDVAGGGRGRTKDSRDGTSGDTTNDGRVSGEKSSQTAGESGRAVEQAKGPATVEAICCFGGDARDSRGVTGRAASTVDSVEGCGSG